jgi:hypothetical protein
MDDCFQQMSYVCLAPRCEMPDKPRYHCSRRPLTAEARVSSYGFLGGQSDTGMGISGFSLSVSFHRGSLYSYHLEDEQCGRSLET